ncbi:hypothetical protein MNBD_GAMMA12-3113 [hydrothermal vent metagenome]|uniref:Lipoprotein n=1 Tax=hydrothermal vent metagenome TaxID=652676 RepID=A0A3B0Z209_9ZZZZ
MKLLFTVLLLTLTLLLGSCGSSPDPKTECPELMKLSMLTTLKLAKKMPGNMGRSLIADMKKKENQDKMMKECMAATPGKRAKNRKRLESLLRL